MLSNVNILVVEDDDVIRYLCKTVLKKSGYQITDVTNIADARTTLEQTDFNLLILDLSLPDGDGLSFIQQLEMPSIPPVLIMTKRGAPQERYHGFEAGAADYLVKPFHPGELVHRVKSLLPQESTEDSSEHKLFRFGNWVLDLVERTLSDENGTPINLTQGEFDLLAALAEAKGRVLSREWLVDAITRGESDGHPRTVDVLVSRLRKKLETDPRHPRYILTVPRLGYRLGTLPS